jgi:sulfur carrier protein ThiS
MLDELVRPVLARCLAHRIPIVSNFGAANPLGAGRRIQAIARSLGLREPRVAVVHGDDVAHRVADTLMSADLAAQLAAAPSSAPTPTSARSPLPMRCARVPTWW